MTALPQVMTDFQDYLMTGKTDGILPEIVSDSLTAQQRLQVYFDAYRIRLMEVLQQDFPKTHTLLGDEQFDHACLAYLDQHPSTHFSVRYFGGSFVSFLQNTQPFSEHTLPAEMAAFEWTVASTLDAADAPIVALQDLSAISPEEWGDLTFKFHPSVQLRRFNWDTPQLWLHIEEEKPQRMPVESEIPTAWLFWRKEIKSLFRSLTPLQAAFYQMLSDGMTFGEICEQLADVYPDEDVPMQCAQTLYHWVNEQVISSFLTHPM